MCIDYLEAGTAAPWLENGTAVSGLTGNLKLRLLNQDRETLNRLKARFLTPSLLPAIHVQRDVKQALLNHQNLSSSTV